MLGGALLLAGCGNSPLLPDKSVQLATNASVKLSTLINVAAAAAAIYYVYDPLAPNWEIEEQPLNDNTYRLSLKMKRFHTGGAGESLQVLKRRAGVLQETKGYQSYQIVEYSEGIDSQTLGARRVAEGVVRLVKQEAADSFLQN
ncbi:MAG: hypothetical protein LBV49_06440 [Azonexus sp.]|nr:hypothetical protein [Azonexus sp.]